MLKLVNKFGVVKHNSYFVVLSIVIVLYFGVVLALQGEVIYPLPPITGVNVKVMIVGAGAVPQ